VTKIAIVSESDVLSNVTRKLAYDAIRQAFISLIEGSSIFPVAIGSGAPRDSMVAIKSGLLGEEGLVGLKIGTYWPDNHASGQPNHGSTTLLLDPETGYPMALINATKLNGYRTAAANAVATDLLANPAARTLLVVGSGHQAEYEVRALLDVRAFERVLVWGRDIDRARAFLSRVNDPRLSVVPDLQAAVSRADVITTVTTSTTPLIEADWVRPGVHISAMGSDKVGKQELSPGLLERAELYADYPQQSLQIGELQHLGEPGKTVTAIGSALLEPEKHRYAADTLTLFDSSGIALQDISIAAGIYRHLREAGRLRFVEL